MWSARKTTVISARLRCRAGVRNRGQLSRWKRIVESTPSTTTALSRIRETAPAPLVVYQRRVSLTDAGYEPPETAMPEPDEEFTAPEDGCSPLEEALEVVELEEADAVPAVLPDDAATPGCMIALTVPKMPTPATDARAMPAVRLLSRDRARSRARTLTSAALVFSTLIRLRPPSPSSLRATWEEAEKLRSIRFGLGPFNRLPDAPP